ncbi:MAG: aspartate-semialdehyde dehydrogenase [Candidatus Omnitrophica bacterium]|nr:aspartate-semialdehyde dehydrogenase [Candidatus Omnitrophota bacterium]
MKQKRYNVAIVGATGAVGTEMLRVLCERKFPVKGLRLLASKRSAGKRLAFNGARHAVETLTARSLDGVDVALFSAGAARSLEFGPEAVRRGALVVDNSSAFRMTDGVPLVVPEVNPHALRAHRGLVANPNCSTIVMLVALKPLHDAARIKRIIVATYQSVSGAGARAIWQLLTEAEAVVKRLKTKDARLHLERFSRAIVPRSSARVLPAQIAFNLVPQVDVFLDNGSTKEEMKMVQETRKILEAPRMPVSATCVRVPVFMAHSEAVWIETERPLSVGAARRLLAKAPGVRLVDEARASRYPMPLDAAGQDEVLVGRIRKDESVANGLALWISGDNLRKGAATNAVQIAELLLTPGG